jgi:hypothetical protein
VAHDPTNDETPENTGVLKYRYRDSNPGFRRERATWGSRAFPEIPSEQAKRKSWGASGSANRTRDVRFEFGRAAAAGILITGSLALAAPAQAHLSAGATLGACNIEGGQEWCLPTRIGDTDASLPQPVLGAPLLAEPDAPGPYDEMHLLTGPWQTDPTDGSATVRAVPWPRGQLRRTRSRRRIAPRADH